jgi:hypothetical protein
MKQVASRAAFFGLFFDPEDGDGPSEKAVDFQLATWRCLSEDRTLHNRRCDNLKSSILIW